jgi:hypothetical protein
MIQLQLNEKQQKNFFKVLHEMPHVKHDPVTNTGTISVKEKGLELSYKLVAEVSVDSNPENIPEEQIKQGLEESMKALEAY